MNRTDGGDNNLIESQALINFCKTYNLNQIVTQPTRTADSTESLIDVILVSIAKQIIKTELLSSSIREHDRVYFVLKPKKQRAQLRLSPQGVS